MWVMWVKNSLVRSKKDPVNTRDAQILGFSAGKVLSLKNIDVPFGCQKWQKVKNAILFKCKNCQVFLNLTSLFVHVRSCAVHTSLWSLQPVMFKGAQYRTIVAFFLYLRFKLILQRSIREHKRIKKILMFNLRKSLLRALLLSNCVI